MIITENGWSDRGELEDNGRVKYLHDHLKQVLDVLDEGCHVKGYAGKTLLMTHVDKINHLNHQFYI